jgi:hypothetical protein
MKTMLIRNSLNHLYRSVTGHSKKFFWTLCGGGGGGFLAFFWPKFTKNVTGEGVKI